MSSLTYCGMLRTRTLIYRRPFPLRSFNRLADQRGYTATKQLICSLRGDDAPGCAIVFQLSSLSLIDWMAITWIQQIFAMDATHDTHTEARMKQSGNVQVVSQAHKNLQQAVEVLHFLDSDLSPSPTRHQNPNPQRMNVPTAPPFLFGFEVPERNVTAVDEQLGDTVISTLPASQWIRPCRQ